MKERLITIMTGIAALAIIYFLFSSQNRQAQNPLSLPTTEDRGGEGLKGLYSWLQREQVTVVSRRKPLTGLNGDMAMPARGNVLIMSLPLPKQLKNEEQRELVDWLDKGNTLLILGAVYRHPGWAGQDDCFCDAKAILDQFDWTLSRPGDVPIKQMRKPQSQTTFKNAINEIHEALNQQLSKESELHAASAAPVLSGVTAVNSSLQPNLLHRQWSLSAESADNQGQVLLQIADIGLPAAWQINAGRGRIVLFMTADLFGNARLAKADNARLMSNLLDQTLAADAKVIFDDFHFGLSDLYNPEHFFKDSRLHHTLAALGIVWLCYLAGYSGRLAPVRIAAVKLSIIDYIGVTAGFFGGRINKRQLAEALVQHLLTDVSRSRHLNGEAETWRWLAGHRRITRPQLDLLRQAQANQSVSLLKLSNTINYIRTVTL